MYPVLFSIGPVTIYSFGLFLGLGVILGIFYIWQAGRLSALSEEKLLDTTILTILGGLMGARLLYVLSNWSFYADDLFSIFAFWKGGLSFWGALLGGIVVIAIVSRRLHWPVGSLLDLAAGGLSVGAVFGYLGALLSGSSYGEETNFLWGIKLEGLPGTRHPSQILEALLQLVIFLLILKLRRRAPFSGFLALIYLVVYSFGRFFLEFLRGDQTHFLGPFSQAHLLSLVVGVAGVLLLYLRLARLQSSWRINFRQILKPVE